MQYAIAFRSGRQRRFRQESIYSVDFENNLESCLEAANMMEDGDIKSRHVIAEDEEKRHLCRVCETAFHLNLEKRNWGDPAGRVNVLRGLFCCDAVGRSCRQQVL